VSKVARFGLTPVSFGPGGFNDVERPDHASRWTAWFQVTLAFPE